MHKTCMIHVLSSKKVELLESIIRNPQWHK